MTEMKRPGQNKYGLLGKTEAHPYLASIFIILAFICAIIFVSYYYAIYYPITAGSNLSRSTFGSLVVNIFNGYSEKVSLGESLVAIGVAAQVNVEEAAASMLIALALIIIYLIQQKGKAKLTDKWRLLGSFIVSLIISQYAIQAILHWKSGSGITGVSFFIVDSVAIIVIFCLVNVILNYIKLLKEPNFKNKLIGLLLWANYKKLDINMR
jgi:hypothetical protein